MRRAPPRGPAPDRRADQLGPVPRAATARPALRAEIAGMGPAAGDELGQAGAQLAVEAADLERAEAPGRAQRREAGPPEDLVGDEVADAGDAALVEQPGLDGDVAARQGRGQLRRGDAER